jgi:hydroxyethylthiazole kinase-like sugar kinase family protein
LAAELAEEKAERKGPASVRIGLLDELYLLSEQDVLNRVKITASWSADSEWVMTVQWR